MALDEYKTFYNKGIAVTCMDELPKQLIRETRNPIARNQAAMQKKT